MKLHGEWQRAKSVSARWIVAMVLGSVGAMGHAATQVRTSAFTYGTDGVLNKEVIEQANSTLCQVTEYTFDAIGNRTGSTVRNCNGSALATGIGNEAAAPASGASATVISRTIATGYDANGQFPISNTNAEGHTETRTYDAGTGALKSLTGPNGLTTQWQYDSFGRKTLEIRSDGNRTAWQYLYCSGVNGGTTACPTYAKTLIQVTPQNSGGAANGPWTRTYYDALGRAVRTETIDDASRIVKQDTAYDDLGRVAQKSLPYFTSPSGNVATYAYDALGRVLQETSVDDAGQPVSTTFTYNGLVTTTTNALGQTQTVTKNSQGQVTNVKDADNKVLTYQYDPFGNLTKTTDPLGNITTLTYDTRGRKTQMQDPDMGLWKYEYNAYGELVKQTDAKNQVTTQTYDKLGRMKTRVEPGLTSAWTYDSCTKGIGKLCQAQADNGTQRAYTYDAQGRPISTVTTLDTTYASSVTYDPNGRVATRTYPTGFAVKYTYATRGFVTAVRNNSTNALLWSASAADVNERGLLTKYTYGNNVVTTASQNYNTGNLLAIKAGVGTSTNVQNLAYTYDSLHNLQSRQDTNQSLAETFAYDTLNRLKTVNTQGGGVTGIATTNVTYDAIGNILSKSGVGDYTYNSSGTGSVRPHAVANIAGTQATTFTYDANGNMLTGMGRTVTYNGFNMPATITGSGATLTFVYDDAHQRVKQIAPSGTVYYVHPDIGGGLFYEKEVKTSGVTEHRHFVGSPSGAFAVYTQRSVGGNSLHYLHKDHLGSTNAVTDDTGAIIERLAYDAWGKRQFPNGTADITNTLGGINTDRGFTGHEHLEEVGLLHMNGRVYDPTIGRFMSADPFIQAPSSLQSFNRYAYALNNPLNGVDPSGYGFLSRLFKKVIRPVAIAVISYYTGTWASNWYLSSVGVSASAAATTASGIANFSVATVSGAVGGSAAGFTAGIAFSNGDLSAGLRGAFTGGLLGGANEMLRQTQWGVRAIAMGTVGGVGARIQGESFGAGFKYVMAASIIKSGLDSYAQGNLAPKDNSYESSYSPAQSEARYEAAQNLLDEARSDPALSRELFNRCGTGCAVTDVTAAQTGRGAVTAVLDQIGTTAPPTASMSAENGSFMSFLAKNVPGVQAFSITHDLSMANLQSIMGETRAFMAINVSTIPVYAYAQYQGLGAGAYYRLYKDDAGD